MKKGQTACECFLEKAQARGAQGCDKRSRREQLTASVLPASNPRTPSESGKQQLPWGERTSSCRRCLWASQYLKTLWSQNLVRQKQILYIYTGNKIIHVLLSTAAALAETLPGTLGGSQSPALRNRIIPHMQPLALHLLLQHLAMSPSSWRRAHPAGSCCEGCGAQHPAH